MGKLPKNRVPVSVAIPLDMLGEVEENVLIGNYDSRSEYIVQAIQEKNARVKASKEKTLLK